MKKIGILTLYGYVNYGNRLQNYAVQKIFEQYGFNGVTLVVRSSMKPLLKTLLMFFKAQCGSIAAKRYMSLLKFTREYIDTQLVICKDMKIGEKINIEFDYFAVGSDQVWNPYIRLRERDNFFLRFTSKDKRLCVVPSFGVKKIPGEYCDDFKKGLQGFNYLSCREEAGADIIYELTGKKAEVLIDPTLVLNVDDWKTIFAVPKKYRFSKYMLCAFLGDISEERWRVLQNISKTEGLEIINVFDEFSYGPGELLYTLYNSSLICTDSYHFSAFSINFNRPFLSFERIGNGVEGKMFSRIESLLNKFGLRERLYGYGITNYLNCDFSRANYVLELERKKFDQYIKMILEEGQEV